MNISFCLPTYNRLPHLKKCINSISNRFKDTEYEIIIADGGSNDGSIEYLKNLNNIKLIEQKKLTGVVKAFNACFKIAKGKFLIPISDDFVLIHNVITKACELMENESQIGLVSPKLQEPTYGNLHGATLKMRKFWVILPKTFILRATILKKINYFDEHFRTYRVDDDTPLAFLKLGYTNIFTKDVGIIHYRIQDEKTNIAKAKNYDILQNQQEYEYFLKKWSELRLNLKEYLKNSSLKKRKAIFLEFICDKMYHKKTLRSLAEINSELSMALQDWFLERIVIFKDKKYSHLKDFYLAQKYPEEIISSLK